MAKKLHRETRAVVPVVQEELKVGKRVVDSGGGVRVQKRISSHTEHVEVPVWHEEIEVQHVPLGITLDTSQPRPEPRQEGDTLVVPVLEEVPVVVKQLRLKEEVRITRHRQAAHAEKDVDLAREDVTVTRFGRGGG